MAIIGTLPNNIQNGQSVDANPVMADFNFIVNQVNANASPLGTIPPGTLLNVMVISATGVYTPTAGTNSIVFDLLGGGGAGGGANVTGATQNSTGSGGGAGGRTVGRLTSGFSGVTVTLGAGGVAVAGASGGTGGNSTFGALAQANGGAGGAFVVANSGPAAAFGGIGGASAGGVLNLNGLQAPTVQMFAQSASVVNLSGAGAPGPYGTPGVSQSPTGAGIAGAGFGVGGSGAMAGINTGGNLAGGNGAPGVCVIYEYS